MLIFVNNEIIPRRKKLDEYTELQIILSVCMFYDVPICTSMGINEFNHFLRADASFINRI